VSAFAIQAGQESTVKNHRVIQIHPHVLMAATLLMSVAHYVSVHVRQDIAELIVPQLHAQEKQAQIVQIKDCLTLMDHNANAIALLLILDLAVKMIRALTSVIQEEL
jgi:hypothetical protein